MVIHGVHDFYGLQLLQSTYILELFYWTSMFGAKPSSTPNASCYKLSQFEGTPLLDDTKH